MRLDIDDELGIARDYDYVDGQYDLIRFSRIIAQYAATNSALIKQIHSLNREVFQLRQALLGRK